MYAASIERASSVSVAQSFNVPLTIGYFSEHSMFRVDSYGMQPGRSFPPTVLDCRLHVVDARQSPAQREKQPCRCQSQPLGTPYSVHISSTSKFRNPHTTTNVGTIAPAPRAFDTTQPSVDRPPRLVVPHPLNLDFIQVPPGTPHEGTAATTRQPGSTRLIASSQLAARSSQLTRFSSPLSIVPITYRLSSSLRLPISETLVALGRLAPKCLSGCLVSLP